MFEGLAPHRDAGAAVPAQRHPDGGTAGSGVRDRDHAADWGRPPGTAHEVGSSGELEYRNRCDTRYSTGALAYWTDANSSGRAHPRPRKFSDLPRHVAEDPSDVPALRASELAACRHPRRAERLRQHRQGRELEIAHQLCEERGNAPRGLCRHISPHGDARPDGAQVVRSKAWDRDDRQRSDRDARNHCLRGAMRWLVRIRAPAAQRVRTLLELEAGR